MSVAARERVAHFGQPGSLIGVSTTPASGGAAREPAVVILNAGVIHRVGPNRVHVQLARRLAAEGFRTLRFDLSGIGDSEPRPERIVQDSVRLDVADALAYMESATGATSFVLIGLCSGANSAFRYARFDRRVVGAVLLDPFSYKTMGFHLRHYGRRVLRWESWRNALAGRNNYLRTVRDWLAGREVTPVPPPGYGLVAPPPVIPKPEMDAGLQELVDRGVQLLQIFTGGNIRYNYAGQFWHAFPRFRGRREIRVAFFPEAGHTLGRAADQEAVIALIRGWLTATRFARLETRPAPQRNGASDFPVRIS